MIPETIARRVSSLPFFVRNRLPSTVWDEREVIFHNLRGKSRRSERASQSLSLGGVIDVAEIYGFQAIDQARFQKLEVSSRCGLNSQHLKVTSVTQESLALFSLCEVLSD